MPAICGSRYHHPSLGREISCALEAGHTHEHVSAEGRWWTDPQPVSAKPVDYVTRPRLEEYYGKMLGLVASRATCPRRQVGAVVVDALGRVLGTGYNGVPRGIPHCTDDVPCPGRHDASGDSSRCMAVHAEINALLQCARLDLAHTLYVSVAPCFTCAKAICNTSIERVVVLGSYADTRGVDVLRMRGVVVQAIVDDVLKDL